MYDSPQPLGEISPGVVDSLVELKTCFVEDVLRQAYGKADAIRRHPSSQPAA